MISLEGSYRIEFHEYVKTFCKREGVIIEYLSNIGTSYLFNISMSVKQAHRFQKLLKTLEKRRKSLRKSMGFLDRLFN